MKRRENTTPGNEQVVRMYKKWLIEDVRQLLDDTGDAFGFQCRHVPVEISTRMEKTMGSFLFREKEGKIVPHAFRFSEILMSGIYEEKIVRNVIIHEYAHFYTNVYNQVNHMHDEDFKNTCRRLGISEETYFKHLLPEEKKKGYILVCSSCGKRVAVRRKIDSVDKILRMKVSGCCGAKIKCRSGLF